MKSLSMLLLAIALLMPGRAAAQQRICSLDPSEFTHDLDEIETTLRQADFKESGILIEIFDRDWECLSVVVPVAEIVRYAQLKAFYAFHSQDPDTSLQYSRLVEFVAPGAAWPEWVPEEHPVKSQLEYEDETEIVTLDGQYVNHPKKGGVFMNGLFLTSPSGPSEVPVFVQVFDKSGAKIRGFWQFGASFPPELLSDSPTEEAPPKWYQAPDLSALGVAAAADEPIEDEPIEDEPIDEPIAEAPADEPVQEPIAEAPAEKPEKTPKVGSSKRKRRMAWAFGLGGGTAALYGTSWGLRAAYNNNPSDGLYTATNTTVVSTAVVGTAAVSMFVAALLAPKNAPRATSAARVDPEWLDRMRVLQPSANDGL